MEAQKKGTSRHYKQFNRIAVKVLLAREDSNVSLLAERVGITPRYMHDLLDGTRGKRVVEHYIEKVAAILCVPVEAISWDMRSERPQPKRVARPTERETTTPLAAAPQEGDPDVTVSS